jgi:hypothetical protein
MTNTSEKQLKEERFILAYSLEVSVHVQLALLFLGPGKAEYHGGWSPLGTRKQREKQRMRARQGLFRANQQ